MIGIAEQLSGFIDGEILRGEFGGEGSYIYYNYEIINLSGLK